ncbi:hypothetical protein AB9P05_18875 [Roseivirga sp. BDSF3-8]|uniref:hypothetical protein n=1 Tax=Roseivirga sp. BDSF3-8 TaxID=3241598 RepID=UPI003531E722
MKNVLCLSRIALCLIILPVLFSSCRNVYGPARLGMSTQVLSKPFVTGQEKPDTASTYISGDYTRSSYLSDESEVPANDIVNAYTGRIYRSYVKNRFAYTFGGAFSLGNRTFPIEGTPLAQPDFRFYAASVYGEIGFPLVRTRSINMYPLKAGVFYTYEYGESMDFLEDLRNTGETYVYSNRHMPALVVSHELMVDTHESFLIGVDLAQVFNLNAGHTTFSPEDDVSRTFYSLRASLLLAFDQFRITLGATTGLHAGINAGFSARLGAKK